VAVAVEVLVLLQVTAQMVVLVVVQELVSCRTQTLQLVVEEVALEGKQEVYLLTQCSEKVVLDPKVAEVVTLVMELLSTLPTI
jgi:hypothetical protein